MTVFACAMADTVKPETARQVAKNFWLKSLPAGCQHDDVVIEEVTGTGFAEFYIFSMDGGKGFVIVSADDAAYPVLGYSTDSPAGEMGENVRFWLGQYEKEIAYLRANNIEPDPMINQLWNELKRGTWEQPKHQAAVAKMCSTTWNQNPYYNNLCPSGTPAGCSAIATAQVMKYWNWPIMGTGSHSYTPSTNSSIGQLSADFGSTTYDWANMPNALTSSSSATQVNAVATLCYHVGVGMNMDYDAAGSGANIIATSATSPSAENALKNYFGYKTSMSHAYKRNYADTAWCNLLYAQMDAGLPVIYAGFDDNAGHAFVFDGYNANGQFHVNWGWGGYYDGFFSMGALNPSGGGTGTNGSNTFNQNNQILYNIEPDRSLYATMGAVTLPMEGTGVSFNVTSNAHSATAWTATASENWISVNPATGAGSGTMTPVTISASQNNSGADRFGFVTLAQDTDTLRVEVTQLACGASDMCALTVNMSDRYGDGWEGAQLTFTSTDGAIYGVASLESGSYASKVINVCPDTVIVAWTPGRTDSECGFFIQNANNVVWINHAVGTSISAGTIITLDDPCAASGGVGPVRFTITATANNSDYGTVTGGGSNFAFGSTTQLKALANASYRFVKWNDNSIENPRNITITSDKSYTATFADLGGDTLRYDNNTYNTALGAGGNISWGIMLDPEVLVRRPKMTGLMFYCAAAGNYTITVYKGGTMRPSTQLYSGSITLSSDYANRWITLDLQSPITIDQSKTLWVTLKNTNASYPAAMCAYTGNDNGTWISTNGGGTSGTWKKLNQLNRWGTWMMRAIIPEDNSTYTVTAEPNNAEFGSVTGGGSYLNGTTCTLTATPNSGYHFTKWSNNRTPNPYTITVTSDTTITALFEADPTEGINEADGTGYAYKLVGQRLSLSCVMGRAVGIYDVTGKTICNVRVTSEALDIDLPAAGIYLIRVEGCETRRIVVL